MAYNNNCIPVQNVVDNVFELSRTMVEKINGKEKMRFSQKNTSYIQSIVLNVLLIKRVR